MRNENADRAEQLQFLRFLAFGLIFLWHADYWVPEWFPHGNGAVNAVSFFFILSGLVTGYSSFQRENFFSVHGIVHFMWRKVKKVYPLYFLTTIFTVCYSKIPFLIAKHDNIALRDEMVQLLKNLFLMQSWFPNGYFSYNGVGWFLSTVFFLYLITVPLLFCASKIKQLHRNIEAFGFILGLSVMITILYCYLFRSFNLEFWEYVFPLAHIGEYVAGISLAYILRLVMNKISDSFWIVILFSIAEIVALVLWITVMYFGGRGWSGRIVQWFMPNLILVGIFTIGKGRVSRFFRVPILRRLGDISFECFLIHQIVIQIFRMISGIMENTVEGNVFSLFFCFTVTILMSMMVAKPTKTKKESIIAHNITGNRSTLLR